MGPNDLISHTHLYGVRTRFERRQRQCFRMRTLNLVGVEQQPHHLRRRALQDGGVQRQVSILRSEQARRVRHRHARRIRPTTQSVRPHSRGAVACGGEAVCDAWL